MLCHTYLHQSHLQSCWRKFLGLEGVEWQNVVKVGVAHLRPPCLQMRNISIVAVRIHYHSETAEKPV